MARTPHDRAGGAQPRMLLRRLRETLASTPSGGQARLDRIVRLIATNMIAEVCSIYLLNDEGVLELSASEGLNPSAVHTARLALGRGLVGRIAETGAPINTMDAENTPGFQLIPGIGEEIYKSFLGVPIRRDGRTLGVLVVQNKAARRYDDDEVEALELIATVIAEMAEAGALLDPETSPIAVDRTPRMIRGAAAADGVAMGPAALHEPKVVVANPIADNAPAERERLRAAMDELRGEVDDLTSGDLLHEIGLSGAGEHRDVLDAYRMFANDRGWMRRLEHAVDSGLAAEAAVERVRADTRARLQRTADPYLRERLSDIDDLANRLLRKLLGVAPPAPEDLPEGAILIARTLGPGELLDYGRNRLAGVALEEGSAGSHAAVVARALNVPLVVGLGGLIDASETGDDVIVDGDVGRVLLRPEASVSAAYREKLALRAQEEARYFALRDKPAISRDGARVSLQMNAGLLTDLPSLEESGAEGVGLYRTELAFLISTRALKRDALTSQYTRALDLAGDRPVVFRTLDMGGDKQLPFLKGATEENPALGWRAIRIALDRPLLFRTQLQALLRASGGRALSVMFPMIATGDEFRRARALLQIEIDRAEREGRSPPAALKVGAMLETPALMFESARFFQEVDFVSVGGNDLQQFFFAADRGNERVRARYDLLTPSFLRALRRVVELCAAANTPLSFCGEMSGRPVEALALAALGFRTMSMRPAAIGPVKRLLRAVDLSDVSGALSSALETDADPRPLLTQIAEAALAEG